MENNINIFRLLRIARDKKVKELAQDLLITPAYINAIEKGNRIPSERVIRDYARSLNIPEEMIYSLMNQIENSFEKTLLNVLEMICEYDANK